MIIIAVFVVLVFLYSLLSSRLEHTILTAPIVFTATWMITNPLEFFGLPISLAGWVDEL
jgi:hypothetical protein